MTLVTLPFIPFAIIYVFTIIGVVTTATYIGNMLLPYFNKLHAYVIKKGWL